MGRSEFKQMAPLSSPDCQERGMKKMVPASRVAHARRQRLQMAVPSGVPMVAWAEYLTMDPATEPCPAR